MNDSNSNDEIEALRGRLRGFKTKVRHVFGDHHPYTLAIERICEDVDTITNDNANDNKTLREIRQRLNEFQEKMDDELETINTLQSTDTYTNDQYQEIGLWLKDEYNLDDHAIICGNCGAPNDLDAVKQQECCHNCREGIPV